MAQFYADINDGAVSRTGGKNTGIRAHVRGWTVGVRVEAEHVDGQDVIRVYLTGGSGNPTTGRLLCDVADAPASVVHTS